MASKRALGATLLELPVDHAGGVHGFVGPGRRCGGCEVGRGSFSQPSGVTSLRLTARGGHASLALRKEAARRTTAWCCEREVALILGPLATSC